jgi:hypothetical protein
MMQSTLGAYLNDVWYPGNEKGRGIQFDTINPPSNRLPTIENHWQTVLFDSLVYFHNLARNQANNLPSANNTGVARFEPGTARFDSAFQSIISRTNREGGSRFFDKSALYHVA